jgi:Tfp pilus assembly protein PilO
MPDLRGSRRKLQIAIAAMVVADLIAVAVLFSPLVGSAQSRRVTMSELSAELQKKTRDLQPLKGIDQKMVLAKGQISQFYQDRFAARDSELTAELGKLASENGVRILQAKYKQEDSTGAGIVPTEIEGNFSGDYLQLVRFINSLERSKQFFTVDSIGLAGESTGPIKLEVKMHSYLRSGA